MGRQVVFERAVAQFAVTHGLWLDFARYLEAELKSAALVVPVYARAARNCPWWVLVCRHSQTRRICSLDVMQGSVAGIPCDMIQMYNAEPLNTNTCVLLPQGGGRLGAVSECPGARRRRGAGTGGCVRPIPVLWAAGGPEQSPACETSCTVEGAVDCLQSAPCTPVF